MKCHLNYKSENLCHVATRLDLENKSFAKKVKEYEFMLLLLVIFQSLLKLCNVTKSFELANGWTLRMVMSPLYILLQSETL